MFEYIIPSLVISYRAWDVFSLCCINATFSMHLQADFDDHREVKARVELSLSDTQNALIKCRRELKEAHSKMEGLKADVSTYAESDRKAKEEVRLANSAVQQVYLLEL